MHPKSKVHKTDTHTRMQSPSRDSHLEQAVRGLAAHLRISVEQPARTHLGGGGEGCEGCV